jgi:hypothetical protein
MAFRRRRVIDATQAAPSPAIETVDAAERGDLVRRVLSVVANIGILTALLVYFGWVRSEEQSKRLGIDESILGMSTQEYLLRSVRPVIILLLVIALSVMAWVTLDHAIMARVQRVGGVDRVYQRTIRIIFAIALALPVLGWLARAPWPAFAYVAYPLLLAGSLLLILYGLRLRRAIPGVAGISAQGENLLRAATAVLVGLALFTTAANYAVVEGRQLAEAFPRQIQSLPRVVVHSVEPLHIDAPGTESSHAEQPQGFSYSYRGLRLLEQTGGRVFLISDGWTSEYGVVVVLPATAEGIRYDIVRDTR